MSLLEVNWTKEFADMSPYLSGKGGLVHIYGGKNSAVNTFSKRVRNAFREKGCTHVQLNPEDHSTRYPIGMISKLSDKLGVDPPKHPKQVSIGTGNKAGRDVTVSGNYVLIEKGAFDASDELIKRTRLLFQKIKSIIQNRQVVIFLANSHKMNLKYWNWFWQTLWEDQLNQCCANGLLVICSQEYEREESELHEFDFQPALTIELPEKYEGESKDKATQDITDLFSEIIEEPREASKARAETLLRELKFSPKSVHNSLPIHLTIK